MKQKQTKLGRAGYTYGRRWIVLRPTELLTWTVLDREGTATVHGTEHATLSEATTAIDVWVKVRAHA